MNPKNNTKFPLNNHQNPLGNPHQLDNGQVKTKVSLIFSIISKITPFSTLWISFVLTYGAVCMYTNEVGQDEFYRFIFFLQKPVVVVLNCVALLSALLHSIIWFLKAPKALLLTTDNKQTQAWLLITCLWIITIAVSVLLIKLILR